MMLLRTVFALVACAAQAAAFKDTSPYLIFSTSDSPSKTSSRQVQSAADALKATQDFLSSCPSDLYVIVSQPNANAADYSGSKSVPHLRSAMSNANVKTRLTVSEVVGKLNPQDIQEYIISQCDAIVESFAVSATGFTIVDKTSKPLIVRIDFDSLPKSSSARAENVAENDALLQSILNTLPITKYTLMFTTTPVTDTIIHNNPSYDPVFPGPFHMELKRQSTFDSTPSNDTEVRRKQSLFERYQFFTPGLFMGLLVTFILLAILSVGLTALGSLQVSYGAFEKDMGPAAQKKLQ